MVAIRKQNRQVTKKGSIEMKLRNKTICVCEEDDCYIYGYYSFKRASCQGERYKYLFVTSNHVKFKVKLLLMVQRVWLELDTKDKYFFV